MMDKFCNKELVEHTYREINKDRDINEPIIGMDIIEEVVNAQSKFTEVKMKEGSFETITYKYMGKIKPRHKRLQKMSKQRKSKKDGEGQQTN